MTQRATRYRRVLDTTTRQKQSGAVEPRSVAQLSHDPGARLDGDSHCRRVCGGSRARAYSMNGDLFVEEPACAYQPGTTPLAS